MRALKLASFVVACRKRRANFLPGSYFGEPCWDMLLDLLVASEEQRLMTTAFLCSNSDVPYGTALRCLTRLEAEGDVSTRFADGARTIVEITETAKARVSACLEDMLSLVEQHGVTLARSSG